MKQFSKIAVSFMLVCITLNGIGQLKPNPSPMTNPNGLALDTVTNSTAEGPTVYVPGEMKTVAFTVNITKISGTITGKIFLRARTGITGTYGIVATDTLRDQTDSYSFKEVDKGYLYYQVQIAPSGTSSLSYKGTAYSKLK